MGGMVASSIASSNGTTTTRGWCLGISGQGHLGALAAQDEDIAKLCGHVVILVLLLSIRG